MNIPDKFKRPRVMIGETVRIQYGAEASLFITLNRSSDGSLREVFITTRSANASICEALGRLISKGLQYGIPVGKLASQLRGVGGEASEVSFMDGRKYKSIPDAIGCVLEEAEKESSPVVILQAERSALDRMIGELPASSVIDRASLEHRRDQVVDELEKLDNRDADEIPLDTCGGA